MEANTFSIVAHTLTDSHGDDPSQVGPLLEQILPPLTRVTADGYDEAATCTVIANHGEAVTVAIPPRSTVVSGEATEPPGQRALIEEKAWQAAVEYDKWALVGR